MTHYNSPVRYAAPWEDAGKHQTRTSGLRRLWLHPPDDKVKYWTCVVPGQGSTSGDTREEALASGKNW